MPAALKKKAPTLPTFSYECKNAQGNKVIGEVSAANITLAKAQLRQQGLTPIVVKKRASPLFERKQSVSSGDICYFSRQLATMMTAGVPLVQSFDIIAKSVDNRSR